MRIGDCILAVARTRREGGLESVTVSRNAVGCLVVPRLPRAAYG
jgi:hypothetical protein